MARRRLDRAYLTNAYATAIVINNSVQGTYVEFVFHNNDSVAHEVYVREIPQGATPADSHLVVEWRGSNSLRPYETRSISLQPSMDAGDFYSWKADVSSKVTAGGFVLEEAV